MSLQLPCEVAVGGVGSRRTLALPGQWGPIAVPGRGSQAGAGSAGLLPGVWLQGCETTGFGRGLLLRLV